MSENGTERRMVLRGELDLGVEGFAVAGPGDGEVTLEVTATGICGSDVHGYAGHNDRRSPGTVMGHEVSGRVSAVGRGVELPVGTQVALWPIRSCGACPTCAADLPHLCPSRRLYGCVPTLPGGFATSMRVAAANLVPLPAGVPAEWGALVEPLAVGHHAVALAGKLAGARVSVVGGGPIGIASALAAKRANAAEVVVVEPVERRREILAALGLDSAPPGEAPGEVDLAVECVGFEATVRAAIAALRPGGTVVCVGLAEPEVKVPMFALVDGERSVIGSYAHTLADLQEVAAGLGDGPDLSPMIERRVSLESLPEAFHDYAEGREQAVKTLMVSS